MPTTDDGPRERFADLVADYLGTDGVTCPGTEPGTCGFGRGGLKTGGKLFAMLSHDRLVLKLPASRIDALLDEGHGHRFDPRKNGVEMREWLVLDPDSDLDWHTLAEEARAFVGGSR